MTCREPADRLDASQVAVELRALIATDALTMAPTRPLSVQATAQTALLFPPAAPSPPEPEPEATSDDIFVADPDSGEATASRGHGRRNWFLISLVVIAAVLVAFFAITFSTRPSAPDVVPPSYPAVEGPLGTHLQQLQESVRQ